MRTLKGIAKAQMSQRARSLSVVIEDSVQREIEIIAGVVADPKVVAAAEAGDYERMYALLHETFGKIGTEYEGLGYYDRSGIIRMDGVDRKRAGVHLPEGDYVKARALNGKPGVLSIIASMATGHPVFGVTAPIMTRDGKWLGGVVGAVKTDFLVRRISSEKLGRTGYAFMIDRTGVVVAHPDKSAILEARITDEPGLEVTARRMLGGETGTEEYTFRGTAKVVGFAPVELTGWSIGVTQDLVEIMDLVYGNLRIAILVSGVFLAIAIIALLFFSRIISSPVQRRLGLFAQAMEQAAEAMFVIGVDRKIQFVNPAMESIFGRPAREFVGVAPYLENAAQTGAEEIWAVLEHGAVWSGRLTGKRRDGTGLATDVTITPVRDAAGQIGSYLGVGRDVTRELVMEAQMRQAQKMEAIGTLAGGIAHDFNNILGAIFGFTELALEAMKDRADAQPFLFEILKASERARDLVTQILAFSRQTGDATKLMQPRPIVREALKLLRASLPSTIAIRESVTSDAIVLGDPSQVHQVIMNLCTNAGYAMRDTGGVLDVSLHEVEIDEEFVSHYPDVRDGRYVVLTVADTGPGIPPEVRDRIFDPFFTTKPKGEGTGLGLSVVHGIAKAMGGVVTVESELGKGTEFSVYMPVAQGDEIPALPERPSEIHGGTERLLVVDDEETLMRVEKAMLEAMGYIVQGSTHSPSALEAFRRAPESFDAVITDYTMPNVTGYELARKLREIRVDIPIILCSGYLDPNMEKAVRAAGIDAFVRKPVGRKELAQALRQALDRRG